MKDVLQFFIISAKWTSNINEKRETITKTQRIKCKFHV